MDGLNGKIMVLDQDGQTYKEWVGIPVPDWKNELDSKLGKVAAQATYATKNELGSKVDKKDGWGLSKNNFTDNNLATLNLVPSKLDKAVYEKDKETFATKSDLSNKVSNAIYEEDKENFATKSDLDVKVNVTDYELKVQDIEGKINNKVATSDYNADKATFALKDEVNTALDNKVTIEPNKGLSSCDYTKTDQANVQNIPNMKNDISRAEKNAKIAMSDATAAQLTANDKLDKVTYENEKKNFANKVQKVRNWQGGGTQTVTLLAGSFHKLSGSFTHLKLKLDNDNTTDNGELKVYAFQFTAEVDGIEITIEGGGNFKWIGGKQPVVKAGKTYQCSIVNNYAVMGEF